MQYLLRGGKAFILDNGGAWDTWADTGPLNPSPMGEGSPWDIALAAAVIREKKHKTSSNIIFIVLNDYPHIPNLKSCK